MPNPDRKLYVHEKILCCLSREEGRKSKGSFCAQSVTKIVTYQENFELPQYSPHTDLSKEPYVENLAKIASELRVL